MPDFDSLLKFLDSAVCCLEPYEVKDNPYYRIIYDNLVMLYDYVNKIKP